MTEKFADRRSIILHDKRYLRKIFGQLRRINGDNVEKYGFVFQKKNIYWVSTRLFNTQTHGSKYDLNSVVKGRQIVP